jgi:hypothetical protein
MKNEENAYEKLWPIIESTEDLDTATWVVLNAGALLAVSMPFLMVLAGLCGGLWLTNQVQSALFEWFALSEQTVLIFTYMMKFGMLFISARLLWLMVPFIPDLIEGARTVVREGEDM